MEYFTFSAITCFSVEPFLSVDMSLSSFNLFLYDVVIKWTSLSRTGSDPARYLSVLINQDVIGAELEHHQASEQL